MGALQEARSARRSASKALGATSHKAFAHAFGVDCSGNSARGDQAAALQAFFVYCYTNRLTPCLRSTDTPWISSQLVIPASTGCDFNNGGTILVDNAFNANGPAIKLISAGYYNNTYDPRPTWTDFRVKQVGTGHNLSQYESINTDGVMLEGSTADLAQFRGDFAIQGFRDGLVFGSQVYLLDLHVSLTFAWRAGLNATLGGTAGENIKITGLIANVTNQAGTGIGFWDPATNTNGGTWNLNGLSIDYCNVLMDINKAQVYFKGHMETGSDNPFIKVTSPARLYVNGAVWVATPQAPTPESTGGRPCMIQTTGGPIVSIRDTSAYRYGSYNNEFVKTTDSIAPSLFVDNLDLWLGDGAGAQTTAGIICSETNLLRNGSFEGGTGFTPDLAANASATSADYGLFGWTRPITINGCRNSLFTGAVVQSGSTGGTIPTDWNTGAGNGTDTTINGITIQVTAVDLTKPEIQVRFFGTPNANTFIGIAYNGGQTARRGCAYKMMQNLRLAAGSTTNCSVDQCFVWTGIGPGFGISSTNRVLVTTQLQSFFNPFEFTGIPSHEAAALVKPQIRIGCTNGQAIDITIGIQNPRVYEYGATEPTVGFVPIFNTGGGTTQTGAWGITTSTALVGTQCLKLENTSTGTVSVEQPVAASHLVGKKLLYTGWVKADVTTTGGGTAGGNIRFYDALGNLLQSTQTNTITLSNSAIVDWTPIAAWAKVPSGATTARATLFTFNQQGSGNPTYSGVYFDKINLHPF